MCSLANFNLFSLLPLRSKGYLIATQPFNPDFIKDHRTVDACTKVPLALLRSRTSSALTFLRFRSAVIFKNYLSRRLNFLGRPDFFLSTTSPVSLYFLTIF